MDERRRSHYLAAMGVTLWTLRDVQDRPALAGTVALEATYMPGSPARLRGEPGPDAMMPPVDPPGVPVAAETPPPEKTGVSDPAQMDWDQLEAAVAGCRACGLCDTRTNTVFGDGNRRARLMVIGEAPGADEDRAGVPFVGRAGQLLNRMLAAIGYPRESVYIANVLKCRPPGNRDPRPEESLRCQGFLARQVQLIRPGAILAVGRIAAQHLLQTDESVGRLRGRWLELGPDRIPVRVTYHPAYLLRSPEQKAKVWDDLTLVRRRLDASSG
ncbi:uracil-DNA glycosylase [Imhoffiella purpurea]|nr:uracil-DNA glycosylase [Imhoffiella purpurea]